MLELELALAVALYVVTFKLLRAALAQRRIAIRLGIWG